MVALLAALVLATEELDLEEAVDPESGGIVLVIGFILVGIVGAFIASRLAKRARESSRDNPDDFIDPYNDPPSPETTT